MGYPVEMINKETALYALIGENAIESKKEKLFNEIFKTQDLNAKMMPLNIRKDDIGFFIYGFKDSQIKAGYFQQEYWTILHELLEEMSEEAKICGLCDIITVKDKTNFGDVMIGRGAASLIDAKDKTVAVYGNTPAVKSILIHLSKQKPKEIILYDEIVENCGALLSFIAEGVAVDIQRVQNETIMMEKCDIFINGLLDKEVVFDDQIKTILELTYQQTADLNFHNIEQELAYITTKEWIKNG